ncbi:MAG: hypothetical protein IPF59_08165 [Ignavibacteria bacterium]|nr:hypothetical protein [Ignavibacteria bacterium]
MFLIACLGCMVVHATAQIGVVIDQQAMKVNPIARADKPAFTIEGIMIRYPEFTWNNVSVGRSATATFDTEVIDSAFVVDRRDVASPSVKVDSIVTRENGDVMECVIYAQLVDCKLPLKQGSVSLLLPLNVTACYSIHGMESGCGTSKNEIRVSF